MDKQPFEVGDKVYKWKVWKEVISPILYTVVSVRQSWTKQSSSGWIVDCKDEDGNELVGYDSDWFMIRLENTRKWEED